MALTIAGVPVDAWLEKGSLVWQNALDSEPDSLSFNLVALGEDGAPCPAIASGSEVLLTDADDDLIFGGVLDDPTDVPMGKHVGWTCTCQDWRSRADQKVLNARRRLETSGTMAKYLVQRYAPMLGTAAIDTGGQVLPSVRFPPPMRLTEALERLADVTGYVWDILPNKDVVWAQSTAVVAPWGLSDTSFNYRDLSVTDDRSKLRNRVVVLGGSYPASETITERFVGDGLTLTWPLSHRPYLASDHIEFDEPFSDFDVGAGGKWIQTDTSNPSPPAGHTSGDGYLFTTVQAGAAITESGSLQVVGGTGTWGDVRLVSRALYDIGELNAANQGMKVFQWDVIMTTATGEGVIGLHHPSAPWGAISSNMPAALYFNAGTIQAHALGNPVGSTLSYTANDQLRVQMKRKTASIFRVRVQKNANIQTSTWDLDSGDINLGGGYALTAPQFLEVAAAHNKSAQFRVDTIRVINPVPDITLTVNSVAKEVGVLGEDESSSVACLIGGRRDGVNGSLNFFGDACPANGHVVEVTYHKALQVRASAQDPVAIAEAAAIEGGDGVHEAWIDAPECDTPELARTRARQELVLGQPAKTLTFTTRRAGLRAGQILPVHITTATRQRPVSGDFLVTAVSGRSLGIAGAFEFSIEATTRLRGEGSLLVELLRAGKKAEWGDLDDGSQIQEFAWLDDTWGFDDEVTIVLGPTGPYLYHGGLATESGLGLLCENGDRLMFDGASVYGKATYT